jgi:DNA-binding transcriptional LysR family regulator
MFVALAEQLHFGRTADRLGIAQSVLSTQILRIEDRIGTRLFERGRRSAISLTTPGETFLAEARLALAQLERAERIGRMAGRGEAGPVRIGFVMSAALGGSLIAALTTIREHLPAVDIQVEPMDSPDQIAAVSDGRLDLGFIRPRAVYPDNVAAKTIHLDDLVVVCSEKHPLSTKPFLAPDDLRDETFIFPKFPDSEVFGDIVRQFSDARGADPRHSIATKDFVSAISLAAAGYGIVIAPRSAGLLGINGVVLRELSTWDEHVALSLIWRRNWNPRLLNLLGQCFFSDSTALHGWIPAAMSVESPA